MRKKRRFQHKMLSEIHEQPIALRRTWDQTCIEASRIAQKNASNVRMIYFTGSGTSYHACIAANYVVSSVTDYLSSTLPASEFSAWTGRSRHQSGTWLIAISQSGESRDVTEAAKSAKRSRMRVLAVTNSARSKLAKLADFSIASQAGKEEAVTATKSFTATLMATYAFLIALAKHEELASNLSRIPSLVDETLRICEDKLQNVSIEVPRQRILLSSRKWIKLCNRSGGSVKTQRELQRLCRRVCNKGVSAWTDAASRQKNPHPHSATEFL